MNSRYILLYLLTLTITAFGQKANPHLCQLDDYFKNQDRYQIWHSQDNGSDICHTWRIDFNEQLTPSDIDSIRNAFAYARKDASESYMYEYHKDGTDTIKYSMRKIYDWNKGLGLEKALFDNNTLKAEYYYYHEYYEPIGVAYNDMKQLDATAVKALIEPALESVKRYKGANIYPIYWQHDKGYEDNIGPNGGIDAIAFYDIHNHAGKTTGNHYFLPAQYEKEGGALCLLIDSLAHDYVNRHPEQHYHYFYYSTNSDFRIRNILVSNGRYRENLYFLGYYRDEEGLHLFSTTTDGELWMPKEWTKIKRWVNGKKTYLK